MRTKLKYWREVDDTHFWYAEPLKYEYCKEDWELLIATTIGALALLVALKYIGAY